MVTIQQDYTVNELNNLLMKYGNTTLNFNKQAIQDDISRLKDILQSVMSGDSINKAVNKKNIINIIVYLEKIIRKTDNNSITVSWSMNDNVIKSYPIEMKTIPEYSIYSTDYINMNEGKMVYVDYTELANIIAFEIMYRDLDESHESVEEKLQGVGIVGISDSKILTQHFTDSPYELSKILHISDSPYLVIGSSTILDYFGKKEFDAKGYREVVSYSCRSAMSFIVEALLQKCASNNMKFKICSVSDTGIYLLVDNQADLYMQKELEEVVYIRTFGRKLEVKPKLQLF